MSSLDPPNSCCAPKPASNPCRAPSVATSPVAAAQSACCDLGNKAELPGYRRESFVNGWLETPMGRVPSIATTLSMADHRGRWAMRWGIGRDSYRLAPGLYAAGTPDADAPLLISANYKLSFDCLRTALQGMNAWILVVDTKGINVWCAAGKGTFGTEEIIRRCRDAGVENIVKHRHLIVPQLGAPGVAAHLVKQATGFSVIYGPVRASDLPTFLAQGMRADATMRRVTFSLMERLVLTPVEFTTLRKTICYGLILLFFLAGIGPGIFSFHQAWIRGAAALVPGLAGLLAGTVLTPILLPWLPGRAFAFKGLVAGLAASAGLALTSYRLASIAEIIALFLFTCTIASYTAMNFTGSSTYTSPSGVEKEMRRALPIQAMALFMAGLLWVASAF